VTVLLSVVNDNVRTSVPTLRPPVTITTALSLGAALGLGAAETLYHSRSKGGYNRPSYRYSDVHQNAAPKSDFQQTLTQSRPSIPVYHYPDDKPTTSEQNTLSRRRPDISMSSRPSYGSYKYFGPGRFARKKKGPSKSRSKSKPKAKSKSKPKAKTPRQARKTTKRVPRAPSAYQIWKQVYDNPFVSAYSLGGHLCLPDGDYTGPSNPEHYKVKFTFKHHPFDQGLSGVHAGMASVRPITTEADAVEYGLINGSNKQVIIVPANVMGAMGVPYFCTQTLEDARNRMFATRNIIDLTNGSCNGRLLPWFLDTINSQAGHLVRQVDDVGDRATRRRPLACGLSVSYTPDMMNPLIRPRGKVLCYEGKLKDLNVAIKRATEQANKVIDRNKEMVTTVDGVQPEAKIGTYDTVGDQDVGEYPEGPLQLLASKSIMYGSSHRITADILHTALSASCQLSTEETADSHNVNARNTICWKNQQWKWDMQQTSNHMLMRPADFATSIVQTDVISPKETVSQQISANASGTGQVEMTKGPLLLSKVLVPPESESSMREGIYWSKTLADSQDADHTQNGTQFDFGESRLTLTSSRWQNMLPADKQYIDPSYSPEMQQNFRSTGVQADILFGTYGDAKAAYARTGQYGRDAAVNLSDGSDLRAGSFQGQQAQEESDYGYIAIVIDGADAGEFDVDITWWDETVPAQNQTASAPLSGQIGSFGTSLRQRFVGRTDKPATSRTAASTNATGGGAAAAVKKMFEQAAMSRQQSGVPTLPQRIYGWTAAAYGMADAAGRGATGAGMVPVG
jgi:hypothetical protein